jgi:Protein of unknown function (DUF2971)
MILNDRNTKVTPLTPSKHIGQAKSLFRCDLSALTSTLRALNEGLNCDMLTSLAPRTIISRQMAPQKWLYHYTTAAGLLGILSEQAIHATHFRFLNDRSERDYGWDFIMGDLNATLENSSSVGDEAAVDAVHFISNIIGTMAFIDALYLCCFSLRGDDLSQWRGYGEPGTDRYCIRFGRIALRDTLMPEKVLGWQRASTSRWLTLIYDKKKQQSEAKKAVEKAVKSVVTAEQRANERAKAVKVPINPDLLKFSAVMDLLTTAASFKNPSFESEREVRYATTLAEGEETVAFKVGGGHLKPYIELKDIYVTLGEEKRKHLLPVTEITVLPGRSADQAIAAAKILLRKAGYAGVDVKRSKIPYAD